MRFVNRLGGDDPVVWRTANEPGRRIRPNLWNIDYLVLSRLSRKVELLRLHAIDVVLDVGSGTGPYQRMIESTTYIRLDVVHSEGTTAIGDAHQLPFRNSSVDLVVSFQVFEHLEWPNLAIAEIYRVLKPGGRVVITTHGIWPYHGHDFHRWTHEGLSLLISDFSNVKIEPVNGPLGVSAALINHWLRETARVAPSGNIRRAYRLFAATSAIALNATAGLAERFSRANGPYRRVSRDITDVYIATGRKPASL